MLDEYKELCRTSADFAIGWEQLSKNDLCRAYVASKDNEPLQNAYFSAIMYRYWGLISKYYYQSANCATPEECYGWLVDSVACCVNLAAWENPDSSIYNDPNGPDKVINRCMKCARLTYYQFINRKKRKDDFGLLSIDNLKDSYGTDITEIQDDEQDVDVSSIVINEYIVKMFEKKDYFVAFLIDCILSANVFDVSCEEHSDAKVSTLNYRKVSNELRRQDIDYLEHFSKTYNIPLQDVIKAHQYIINTPQTAIKRKIHQSLETLKHSTFIKSLRGSR